MELFNGRASWRSVQKLPNRPQFQQISTFFVSRYADYLQKITIIRDMVKEWPFISLILVEIINHIIQYFRKYGEAIIMPNSRVGKQQLT